ncbi:MAG: hypothetical protein SPG31_00130 [Eubacterium coprostanoligenes]|uniref:hypothetical protein n=1 Tax=Eubacterium coprostanoligenes TaxID=290054 RepID=UPI002A913885|nr:hypothetical protein [Eubacterium coprostanoligenes]MDY5399250.1 hypothetical protein [Eubacterium coprostanoligenes]
MAKHEFGIMDIAPTLKQEYNKYEPEKYHCISVEDEYIESLLKELSVIPCYWHSLQQEERVSVLWNYNYSATFFERFYFCH